jgi:hypothetical protein
MLVDALFESNPQSLCAVLFAPLLQYLLVMPRRRPRSWPADCQDWRAIALYRAKSDGLRAWRFFKQRMHMKASPAQPAGALLASNPA